MAKISAVIITKNEQQNIERCIKSLHNVADEVLVIDNGSTDNTINIAKSLNARVIETTWQGYAATKNFGNQNAENEFILSIDADEALDDELKNQIINVKKDLRIDDAYSFNRLTNYCGKWIKHCGWYPDTKLRLWNKNAGKWEGLIHEEVKLQPYVKVVHLKGHLLHYSYYSSQQHYLQADKFTTLTAQNDFEKGKKGNFFQLIFAPIFKFIKSYFFQLGILDGKAGLQVCRISSLATYWKYKKLLQLSKNNGK